jgi:hypothetical protein
MKGPFQRRAGYTVACSTDVLCTVLLGDDNMTVDGSDQKACASTHVANLCDRSAENSIRCARDEEIPNLIPKACHPLINRTCNQCTPWILIDHAWSSAHAEALATARIVRLSVLGSHMERLRNAYRYSHTTSLMRCHTAITAAIHEDL